MNGCRQATLEARRMQEYLIDSMSSTVTMLRPPSTQCPFCNEAMEQRLTVPDVVLVLTEKGFEFGRHVEYVCKHNACPAAECTRHYDAISYKIDADGDTLHWQLERPGWCIEAVEAAFHRDQPRHVEYKFFQVDSRVFVSKDLVKSEALQVHLTAQSFFNLANLFQMANILKCHISDELLDAPFAQLLKDVARNTDLLGDFHRYGFYLLVLTGQALKQRYGETVFARSYGENTVICPLINVDMIGPIDRYKMPLLYFIRWWRGELLMKIHSEEAPKVDFGSMLKDAVECYMDIFKGARREESLHTCNDCLKVNPDGKSIYAAAIKSFSMAIPCCKSGEHEHTACKEQLHNMEDQYCRKHQTLDKRCLYDRCQNCRFEGGVRCAHHMKLWWQFYLTRKENDHVLRYSKYPKFCHVKTKLPENPRLEENVGWRVAVSQLLSNKPELREAFQSGESRLDEFLTRLNSIMKQVASPTFEWRDHVETLEKEFTLCDIYLTLACGYIVSRRLAYRSEGLQTVLLQLLIATDGGKGNVPNYLFYGKACALLYYLAGLILQEEVVLTTGTPRVFGREDCERLFSRMLIVRDPMYDSWHYHPSYLKSVCDQHCSAENTPTYSPLLSLLTPTIPMQPSSLFDRTPPNTNDESYECSFPGLFGSYQQALLKAPVWHSEFYLHCMVLMYNELYLKATHRDGKNHVFLHPVHDVSALSHVQDNGLQEANDVLSLLTPAEQGKSESLFDVEHLDHNLFDGLNRFYQPSRHARYRIPNRYRY